MRSDMTSPKVAIFGTGANGAAIGADMTKAGIDVILFDQWPENVEAMRANGLRINSPDGVDLVPVRAMHFCEVATVVEPFDYIFTSVKAYDTEWVCELMRPVLSPNGLAVGLQNGMTVHRMAAILGDERTLGAVIEIAGNMFVPGIVNRQTGPSGTWFAVGGVDETTSGRAHELADLLKHSGEVEVSDDIIASKWMKLIANAGEVLPSAVLGLPLAEAIHIPGMRQVMEEAGREAIRAALGLGISPRPIFGEKRMTHNDPERYAVSLFEAVLSGWTLPTTLVATLQDWKKGRRGETDDFNGIVLEAHERLGTPAPISRRLLELAHDIEAGRLRPEPANAAMLTSMVPA
jgi:2-dehydropantoate 2-reductase